MCVVNQCVWAMKLSYGHTPNLENNSQLVNYFPQNGTSEIEVGISQEMPPGGNKFGHSASSSCFDITARVVPQTALPFDLLISLNNYI